MKSLSSSIATAVLAVIGLAQPAQAVLINGIEFPQGAISFADEVVAYAPVMVGTGPTAPHREPSRSLGLPDYAGDNSCASGPECTFVSLGDGGTLTLRFVDNLLTGSGDNKADLWIFEVGPDVEDMFVEISTDGLNWLSVGKVGGSTAGVDLDFFGHGVNSAFAYVRLRDDPLLDGQSGSTVGADIDSVGAISTVPSNRVPEPSSLALLLAAMVGLGVSTKRGW